jgi:hypothetical protein
VMRLHSEARNVALAQLPSVGAAEIEMGEGFMADGRVKEQQTGLNWLVRRKDQMQIRAVGCRLY